MLTWREAGTFADMQTLWRTTLARNPNCWMAYNNLGLLLASRGELDEAIPEFQQALKLATAQRNATLAAAARARLQSLSSAPPP